MSSVFRDLEGPLLCPHGSVACIGGFDGVHLGHRALIERTVARARALGVAAVALTFEPLPRELFAPRAEAPPRLMLPRDKVGLLRALGIDHVGLLRFDAATAAMPAEAFIRTLLCERLRVREVWIGPDFRFGHRRAGDLALLQATGERCGFAAHAIAPVQVAGEPVSSTRIREALQTGDFAAAETLLGRPYRIGGRVVRGRQLGRTLGYPTANLRFDHGRPALQGIYATWVHGVGDARWPSVSSFGTRPTVDGREPILEAHLFDFDGDLYGQCLQVEFVHALRNEERFDDLDALVAQMHRDAARARALLSRSDSDIQLRATV